MSALYSSSADPTLFCNPHLTIAEVCLAYTKSRYFSNSSLDLLSNAA